MDLQVKMDSLVLQGHMEKMVSMLMSCACVQLKHEQGMIKRVQ